MLNDEVNGRIGNYETKGTKDQPVKTAQRSPQRDDAVSSITGGLLSSGRAR
jgi:hypothetical protein